MKAMQQNQMGQMNQQTNKQSITNGILAGTLSRISDCTLLIKTLLENVAGDGSSNPDYIKAPEAQPLASGVHGRAGVKDVLNENRIPIEEQKLVKLKVSQGILRMEAIATRVEAIAIRLSQGILRM